LGDARDLETVTFIERDRPWIRGLKERREMIRIDDGETLPEQRTTESGPSPSRVDA
jgi:hypothetical protein